jgi:hypothetical protein
MEFVTMEFTIVEIGPTFDYGVPNIDAGGVSPVPIGVGLLSFLMSLERCLLYSLHFACFARFLCFPLLSVCWDMMPIVTM